MPEADTFIWYLNVAYVYNLLPSPLINLDAVSAVVADSNCYLTKSIYYFTASIVALYIYSVE